MLISDAERRFVRHQPVARLGTADRKGNPHVVPVCFALGGDRVYIAIDEKPKTSDFRRLKRLRNISANPGVCLTVDRYDPDWSRLGWVMLRGRAEVADGGAHRDGIDLLRARYVQYENMDLEGRPLIVIRIETVNSWGDLSP